MGNGIGATEVRFSFRSSFAVACLLAATGRAIAWESPAPEVVLYCTPALATPLRAIAQKFRSRNDVEVHIFIGSPNGQVGLIRHRARADVVIADTPTIASLGAGGLVRPETIVALGGNPYILVSQTDAAIPTGQTPAQLVAQHAVVLPDATTASTIDGAQVLRAALQTNAPHVLGVADTPTVIALVEGDRTLLGLVNKTEAGAPGVHEVAQLSTPPVPNSGGLVVNGQSRNAAALLAFIAGPEGRAVLTSAGLETRP
jgi:ABC-type molybdate transport system substrate-binding protein